jgi:23S rRNA pseudouridine1911/1915/1917 synthase
VEKLEITVPEIYIRKRLDAYLADALTGRYSRQEIKSSIVRGGFTVNGAPALPKTAVKTGDRIEGTIDVERTTGVKPESIPLKVVYEDEYLIVIDKPVGMVVHPGAGNAGGTLVNALVGRGQALAARGGEMRPGIVHRLDKSTSGLLVVAKTNGAHRKLQAQFERREVTKVYLALVRGAVEFEEGRVSVPIRRHPKMRDRMAALDDAAAKEAESSYRVIRRFGKKATLLEVRIRTGRTHQIRVHMAHLGHPVVGDTVYGRPDDDAPRVGLHAARLEFVHPATGEPMRFESEPPKEFSALTKKWEEAG